MNHEAGEYYAREDRIAGRLVYLVSREDALSIGTFPNLETAKLGALVANHAFAEGVEHAQSMMREALGLKE